MRPHREKHDPDVRLEQLDKRLTKVERRSQLPLVGGLQFDIQATHPVHGISAPFTAGPGGDWVDRSPSQDGTFFEATATNYIQLEVGTGTLDGTGPGVGVGGFSVHEWAGGIILTTENGRPGSGGGMNITNHQAGGFTMTNTATSIQITNSGASGLNLLNSGTSGTAITDASAGGIQLDVTTSHILSIVGLPTSAPGAGSNKVWRDASGFLKIA